MANGSDHHAEIKELKTVELFWGKFPISAVINHVFLSFVHMNRLYLAYFCVLDKLVQHFKRRAKSTE